MSPRTLTLLALLGCAPEPDVDGLPGDALGPPSVELPALLPGQPFAVTVSGLVDGTAIVARASQDYRPGRCASVALGACLEVGAPAATGRAIAAGGVAVAVISQTAGLAQGDPVVVQLVGAAPGGATGRSAAVLRVAGCGDGVLAAGEACDDGDVRDGDGCDATCAPTPQTTLRTTGFRASRCVGDCRAELSLSGSRAVLTVGDVTLSSISTRNTGRLTLRGQARLDAVRRGLDGVVLLPVYGCPDCYDQGAGYLDVERAGQVTHHEYDPMIVPAVLADARALDADWQRVLATCAPSDELLPDPTCAPR